MQVKPNFIIGLTFFALSASAQAQNLINFKQCVDATTLASTYTSAARQRAQQQLDAGDIATEKYQQTLQEIADFQTKHTLEDCMEGSKSAVYFCLLEHEGNFSSCQS